MSENIVIQRVNGVLITTNLDAPPTYRKGKLVCNKVKMQLAPIKFEHAALKK